MIVTCPACATRYSMDPVSLGPEGRRVRCAKCKHTWHQVPPDDMPRRVDLSGPDQAANPQAPAAVPPGPKPPGPQSPGLQSQGLQSLGAAAAANGAGALGAADSDRVAIPPRPRPARARGMSGGLGFLVLLLTLLGLGAAAAYFGRHYVVGEWPQTRDLYAQIGIPVPILGEGLELSNITFVYQMIENQPVLVVHGEIFNKTDKAQPLPNLLATLQDERKRWLFDWVFKIDKSELGPGETTTFTTTAKNPPKETKLLAVTFTEKPIGN